MQWMYPVFAGNLCFKAWSCFSKELLINFAAFTSMPDSLILLGTGVGFLFLTQQMGIYPWCVL